MAAARSSPSTWQEEDGRPPVPATTPVGNGGASSSTAVPSGSGSPADAAAAGECIVCMDKPASHLVVPCGHQCLCEGCVALLRDGKCPVCRNKVDQCIRVFACGWQNSQSGPGAANETKRKQRSRSPSAKKKKHKQKDGKTEKKKSTSSAANAGVATLVTATPRTAADPTAAVMAEVASLKRVLDATSSSDAQVGEALQKLASGFSMPLTEPLLKQSLVGFSVNAISKDLARGASVRIRAQALVQSWKQSILAARATQSNAVVEVSTPHDSSRSQLEVVAVNMGRAAQRRIARHATAARDQTISRPLPVEDCIDLDDEDSHQAS